MVCFARSFDEYECNVTTKCMFLKRSQSKELELERLAMDFLLVAEAVRNLAQRSAESAEDITNLMTKCESMVSEAKNLKRI